MANSNLADRRPAHSELCAGAGRSAQDGLLEAAAAVVRIHATACILADAELTARDVNSKAGAILDRADGLLLTPGGRIRASFASCTRRLGESVAQVTAPEPGALHREPDLLRIERPSGKPPYVVVVHPCPSRFLRERSDSMALLLVNEPHAVSESLVRALMKAFSLTRSEAQVGVLLMRGASAQKISKARFVSIATVRTHIRSVLQKTFTNSQVEFLSLAFSTLGPAAW